MRLLANAGGVRLALHVDAVKAVGLPGAVVAVPGGQPWLLGLTAWHGRLYTVIDAGLLFGRAPALGAGLVVLEGLGIDVALAVDDLRCRSSLDEAADVELDRAALSAHPAFQPGAATRGAA